MTSSTPQRSLSSRQLVVHLAFFLGLLLLLGFLFQEDIEHFATYVITHIGLSGLICIIVFIETFPTPIGAAVPMYIAIQGGYSPWEIWFITSMTSILSGHIGYWLGYFVGFPKNYQLLIQSKWPTLLPTFQERGAIGVAIAAMLPIPLSFLTWTSGAIRMNYVGFSLAMFTRLPKLMIYVLTIISGLSLTA